MTFEAIQGQVGRGIEAKYVSWRTWERGLWRDS